MKFRYHILSGSIAASLLIPVIGVNSVAFWVSSVLIDSDHYLDYIYRNGFKDFSLKRMFTFHDLLLAKGEKRELLELNVMHTVEFILLVYAATILTGWMWLKVALWGILFHMVFDLFYLYRERRLLRRAMSIIEYAIRRKRMKRQGLNPELPYRLALQAMSPLPTPSGDKEENTYK